MKEFIKNDTDYHLVLSKINTMIEESSYHAKTFAHSLKAHHNSEASEVFMKAHEQFTLEQVVIMQYIGSIELPSIAPWEIPFSKYIHPSLILLDVHYLTNEEEALKTVETMTEVHNSFYNILLKQNTENKVLVLANELIKHHQEYKF